MHLLLPLAAAVAAAWSTYGVAQASLPKSRCLSCFAFAEAHLVCWAVRQAVAAGQGELSGALTRKCRDEITVTLEYIAPINKNEQSSVAAGSAAGQCRPGFTSQSCNRTSTSVIMSKDIDRAPGAHGNPERIRIFLRLRPVARQTSRVLLGATEDPPWVEFNVPRNPAEG